MHCVTDVFLGTWPKFTEQLFFLIYAKQKPVEYSPGGAFDLLMLVVMKELKGVLEIFKE